ncbi:MAG TPA: hypothetical protein VIG47_12335 [Gemmatimonadaceae bacterium]
MLFARLLRTLAVFVGIAALVVGVMPVAASPASITVSGTYIQGSGVSIAVSWNSGTDNNAPQVWVCTSYNGAPPLSFDFGSSGNQTANFIRNGTYVFGLFKDSGCTTLFHNQTTSVTNG